MRMRFGSYSLFFVSIPSRAVLSFLVLSDSSTSSATWRHQKSTRNIVDCGRLQVIITSALESVFPAVDLLVPSENIWLAKDDGLRFSSPAFSSVQADMSIGTPPRQAEEECVSFDGDDEEEDEEQYRPVILPLYPLPVVYLPTGPTVEYTLINVEPRNIQMALDLLRAENDPAAVKTAGTASRQGPRRFCAVLRTVDTGRFAATGTILRIVQHEKDFSAQTTTTMVQNNGVIQRIRLTCVAEEIVDIVSIVNPDAQTLEYRWTKNPREYLRALVRPRRWRPPGLIHANRVQPNKDWEEEEERAPTETAVPREQCAVQMAIIVENYNHVRNLLVRGIGVDMLPRSCRDDLATRLPPLLSLSSSQHEQQEASPLLLLLDDDNSLSFWSLALVWQTLCNSYQEGHRSNLIGTRNEMLVEAAIRAKTKNGGGGPLHLPVQLSDLDRSDREAIAAYEVKAQSEWMAFGMNPVLDFQFLLHAASPLQRLERFALMMTMARNKFDQIAATAATVAIEEAREVIEVQPQPPPKGAWFDDSLW